MKIQALLVACAAATASASTVNIRGAEPAAAPSAVDVRIAAKDLLNNPTALLNKNTLAMDNNVYITRSNLIFTQNDRIAMRKKVEEALNMPMGDLSDPALTAVLTKNVLRAVSSTGDDKAVMSKASAVVAAKGDPSTVAQKIADFVDTAANRDMDKEQALQSNAPRGVVVLIGTKDILRQPTGVINKNFVMNDNQVAIARSDIKPTQNDQIVLTGGAKVADAIAPAAAIKIGQITTTEKESAEVDQYRVAFMYPKEDASTDDEDLEKKKPSKSKHEQFGWGGGWGGGWGLGWRYPLGMWNTWGAGLYGGGCGLGFAAGPFYYC